MKKSLLLLGILFTTLGFAQPGPRGNKKNNKEREERIRAEKISFMTAQLNLNTKEAEAFWPLFNEYETKMENNRKTHRREVKKLKNYNDLTEEAAYATTEKILKLEVQGGKIRQEYLIKFAAALGKKKAAKVFYAEEKFKRELLKKIKKGNNQGPRNDGPPPGGSY
jgi:Spy/CpxP family protein refolding chaperone